MVGKARAIAAEEQAAGLPDALRLRGAASTDRGVAVGGLPQGGTCDRHRASGWHKKGGQWVGGHAGSRHACASHVMVISNSPASVPHQSTVITRLTPAHSRCLLSPQALGVVAAPAHNAPASFEDVCDDPAGRVAGERQGVVLESVEINVLHAGGGGGGGGGGAGAQLDN